MACHLSYFYHISPTMRTIATEPLTVTDHTGKAPLGLDGKVPLLLQV